VREQWDVRGVEVAGVEDAVALEAHEDLAVGEEWIFVDLHLALDGADVHDADVHAFGGEGVAGAEVVQLLELGAMSALMTIQLAGPRRVVRWMMLATSRTLYIRAMLRSVKLTRHRRRWRSCGRHGSRRR
jgi:hypothetical protein